MRRDRLAAGVRTGGPPALALAAGWLILAAVPAARPVLGDRRITGLTGRGVAYQALVRIPVGTVLWEEAAFRGVLQASLRRVLPGPAAIAVTSAVFGLWHIRPTADALRINQIGGQPPGGAGPGRGRRGGHGRGRPAAVRAAGTVRQPGRAHAAAPHRQLRRRAGRLGRPEQPAAGAAGQAETTAGRTSRRGLALPDEP